MDKISVIIPMYNSEDFIRQCVGSVIAQTYRELEILVIDDGSTDCSREVCRELAQEDRRIRLCTQENRGASSARNRGLEAAMGEYVFFLDSDDAVHPLLLEKMVGEMKAREAGMAFCGYRRLKSAQMRETLAEVSSGDSEIQWKESGGAETEEWFHKKYRDEMSGIGGKMVRAELIRSLRFDEELVRGEDTFFVYQLVCGQIKAIFCSKGWYYYRMHSLSATHAPIVLNRLPYFECAKRIRDSEYRKGNADYALTWERCVIQQIERGYLMLKGSKNRGGCAWLRKFADTERKHPLYHSVYLDMRLLFACCFCCFPLYYPLKRVFSVYADWKGDKGWTG